MSDPKEIETKADDETEAEPEADREDTGPTRIPAAEPTVEDIVAMIDSLTKADRQRLMAAVRALYGSER